MNIGTGIKQIRKAKGMSQGELAERSELSQPSLSLIESGTKRPSARNIKKICKALDVPEALVYLYTLEDSDIPESKKDAFNFYYPSVKDMISKIIIK